MAVGLNPSQLTAAIESIEARTRANHQLQFTLHLFESVPSTNQTLWELIDRGAAPGTVVVAIEQTAGRGQWGRQWYSPIGGLYLSVALAPNLPVQLGTQLTLCSAWGIATALREYNLPVSLKWPNDLILKGRKLGGILTETKVQEGKIAKTVVGVGINWVNPVPETGINLQSFLVNSSTSSVTSLEILAAITLTGLISGYECWQREGIDALLPSYENLLTNMGNLVAIEGNSGVIVGVCPTGDLRVRLSPETVATSREICIKPGTISLGYA